MKETNKLLKKNTILKAPKRHSMKYILILLLLCGCKVEVHPEKQLEYYTVYYNGTNSIECDSYFVSKESINSQYKLQCYSDYDRDFLIFETLVTNYTVIKN